MACRRPTLRPRRRPMRSLGRVSLPSARLRLWPTATSRPRSAAACILCVCVCVCIYIYVYIYVIYSRTHTPQVGSSVSVEAPTTAADATEAMLESALQIFRQCYDKYSAIYSPDHLEAIKCVLMRRILYEHTYTYCDISCVWIYTYFYMHMCM